MKSNNWKFIKLNSLIESVSDTFQFKTKDKDIKSIYFLNTSDVLEGEVINHNKYNVKDLPGQAKKKFQKFDILYSEIRPQNKRYAFVNFDSSDYVASTKLMVLRNKDENQINTRYLYTLLTNEKFLNKMQALAEGRSGTFPQITFNMLKEEEVYIPSSLDEQKKIVDILDSIELKINLNNKINEKLEETAKALYHEWFVNFNFPNENGLPYKDNGGEFVDSELGKIPVGWEVVELKSIFNFQKGKKPIEIVEYEDENYLPYITLDAIRNNNVQYAKNEKVITINELNNIMVMDGASSGEIYFGYKGVLGSTFSVLNIYNESLITSSILYYMIKSIEQQIKDNTTGSAIPHTDKELVYKTLIAIPKNVDIINDIDKILLKFRLQMINNSNQNIKLDNLKNLLLNKLMSGQIDVDKLNIDWDKLDKTLKEVENLV
ncbi:MAG: hypothetical protein GX490_07050 [Bacilli bacterium]|nr:hypothetical protein [Bacilli bacterium]